MSVDNKIHETQSVLVKRVYTRIMYFSDLSNQMSDLADLCTFDKSCHLFSLNPCENIGLKLLGS